MSFGPLKFTSAGRALMLDALTGKTLTFTKIKIGDGFLTSQAPESMTGLVNPLVTVDIASIRRSGQYVSVRGSFTNSGLAAGFYWREVGLFAADPETGEDVLYCYQNAYDLAEYIAAAGSEIIEKTLTLIAQVGDAPNVSIVVNGSLVYLTPDDLDAHNADPGAHAESIEVHNADASAHAEAIQQSIAAHNTDAEAHGTAFAAHNAASDAHSALFAGKAALGTAYTGTLTVAGWTGSGPYTQVVSIPGLVEPRLRPDFALITSGTKATDLARWESWAYIQRVVAETGKVTVTCYEDKPTVALPFTLEVHD